MDRARVICSVALGLRKAQRLRVRLPLGRLRIATADTSLLAPFTGLIADEVNVRDVHLVDVDSTGATDLGVEQRLTVNARAAGPRLGKDVQAAIRASKSGDWKIDDAGTVTAGGIQLEEGEYAVETVATEGSADDTSVTGMLHHGGFIVLDTAVTAELAREGLARDVVRVVQQARRDAGLDVSDRIGLTVLGDQTVWEATVTHRDMIMDETLAVRFDAAPDLAALPDGTGTEATVADGQAIRVLVERT
ncbi:MAG: DUF5915 domain-containing protein, partial [Nocardioidaceae bacterium]